MQAAKGRERGGRGYDRGKAVTELISTEPITTAATRGHRKGGRGRGGGRGKVSNCENKGVIEASNKDRKEKQIVKPISTAPISKALTSIQTRSISIAPDNNDDEANYSIDDDGGANNNISDSYINNDINVDGDNNNVDIEIADDDSNEYFNAASSMSAFTSTKRSLSRITDLLRLTDSEEEAEETEYIREKRTQSNKRRRNYDIYKDLDDEEEIATRSNKKTGKPGVFCDMKNAFEVCHWLVMERPDILTMANQMTHALNTKLESSPVNMVIQPSKPAPQEEKSLARLWHEEVKCLFLRCRAPPSEAIESLVRNIFNYDLYSNDAEEVICHSKRVLTDFRSKFNKKIIVLVNELKDRRSREGQNTTIPTRSEIAEFISQDVENVLGRYLTGTNRNILKRCGTIEKLVQMVREAFMIHYTNYNIEAIKKLDRITKNCKVPSRSGKNIASRLSLE